MNKTPAKLFCQLSHNSNKKNWVNTIKTDLLLNAKSKDVGEAGRKSSSVFCSYYGTCFSERSAALVSQNLNIFPKNDLSIVDSDFWNWKEVFRNPTYNNLGQCIAIELLSEKPEFECVFFPCIHSLTHSFVSFSKHKTEKKIGGNI